MYHLELDFLNRHPDINLRCGRSSEDGTFWADVRERQTGKFIAFHAGKDSLFDALAAAETDCVQWYKSFYSAAKKSREPRFVNYGLATDIEPKDE